MPLTPPRPLTWFPQSSHGSHSRSAGPDHIHEYSRGPDDREVHLQENISEDSFQHSGTTLNTFRSTQLLPRRPRQRSPNRLLHPSNMGRLASASPSSPSRPPLPAAPEPVDLRLLDYAGAFDQNLMCAICHCPFIIPVKLNCDHVFCHECITSAMEHQIRSSKSCPTCRTKANKEAIIPVPKLVTRMVDELPVRCPHSLEGCTEILKRGTVQDHVDRYCEYVEVRCSKPTCFKKVKRKDADKRCLHVFMECPDCHLKILERDIEQHRVKSCKLRKAPCSDCKAVLPFQELDDHLQNCSEAFFPCTAKPFGCEVLTRRSMLDEHQTTCPLARLAPFLHQQNARLEYHESALKLLHQKNSLLEDSFSSIKNTLVSSSNLVDVSPSSRGESDLAPFDSTAAHLLSLHESLREEVTRVSRALSDLDLRASAMVMSESLRNKEDLTHLNAAVGSMRMQLHWLVSTTVQSQQRVAMASGTQSLRGGIPSSMTIAGVKPSVTTGLSGEDGQPGQPGRRLSDSTRQETRL